MNNSRGRRRQPGEPCECLRPLIRIFGFLTSIVLCGIGVDVHSHGYQTGLFILLFSCMIFFIETKWIITLFLQLLPQSRSQNIRLSCWSSLCKCLGGWRPAPGYVALGVALVLWPHNLWLSYVGGSILILLAIMRLCLLFRFSKNSKEEGLLPHNNFDNIQMRVDIPDIQDYAEIRSALEQDLPINDLEFIVDYANDIDDESTESDVCL